jgi:uncharacterized membrane protein
LIWGSGVLASHQHICAGEFSAANISTIKPTQEALLLVVVITLVLMKPLALIPILNINLTMNSIYQECENAEAVGVKL